MTPPYKKYKDSLAEWLGSVPEHWTTRRLGYYFAERRDVVSDRDYAALSVTKKGILPQLDTAAKTDDGDNRRLVFAGDFVINSRSDRKGSSGLSAYDGSVSLINTVLYKIENVSMMYATYLMKSHPFQEEFYRMGRGIVADLWSTNYTAMRNILLALPSYPEQLSIVGFLDRETAKIDALVAGQERLIGLLKEKRQAVISHAVTKGLDPDVPMKDSGVEWLGEVPAHWKVVRLKYVAGGITVGVVVTPSQYYASEGIPALRSLNVRNMSISTEQMIYFDTQLSLAVSKSTLHTDDLVAVRTGKPGTTAIIPPDLNGANCVDLIIVRSSPQYISRFMAYVMNSEICRIQYEMGAEGSIQQHFNIETAGNLYLTVPKPEDQGFIVRYLDEQTAKLDGLTAQATQAVELLNERRAALISAAVTGKIDVRSLAPPVKEAA